MRTPIIAGNWKMFKTIEESIVFIEELKKIELNSNVEVVVCAPFLSLKDLKEKTKGTCIKIGAQNMHFEEEGAFTGEISPRMLKEIGVDFVIIGHSERRQYFNETDETVNLKIKKSLEHDITPILCVGESLEQRESGSTKNIVSNQISAAFLNIEKEEAIKIVVAYEPIWAIGTGKTATSDQANETISDIREKLVEIYGEEVANQIRIQYGGSVKPENVSEIMSKEHIDGALVGGASLKADSFSKLVNF